MGAFHSFPKVRLDTEANVMPLSLHRERVMYSAFLQHQMPTTLTLTPILDDIPSKQQHGSLQRLCVVVSPSCIFLSRECCHTSMIVISYSGFIWFHPWPTPTTILRSLERVFSRIPWPITVYMPISTGGSKMIHGVGAFVVFPDRSLTASSFGFTFTLEPVAILLDLSTILFIHFIHISFTQTLLGPYRTFKFFIQRTFLCLLSHPFLHRLHSKENFPSAGSLPIFGEAVMKLLTERFYLFSSDH